MKRIQIILLASLSLFSFLVRAQPAKQPDSLVIQFANQTKLIIYAPDRASIQALSAYDLNKIVQDMGMKLDSVPDGQTSVVVDNDEGQRYLKDTVLIVTKRNGDYSVVFKDKGERRRDTTRTDSDEDYRKAKLRYRNKKSGLSVETDFHIGLNNWIRQSQVPGYTADDYALRPLGSRYFAISLSQNPTLARSRGTKLSLRYALQLAWNNFMFDDDLIVRRGATNVVFDRNVGGSATENLKKSKLTVASLELPVAPRITFYNASGRKAFHLGVGGFVGYRVGSYTKVKYVTNNRDHNHDRFYLNDFQYGLLADIGILRTNLFVKYNLNPVFRTNRGPDLQALSFGVTL